MPPFPRRVSTRWAGFSVVDLGPACEATGLTLEQLLAVPGVEQMTRVQAGLREQAVRIPIEILEAAAQNREALTGVLSDYTANGTSDAELRARIREIVDAETSTPQ
jgi:hypothetical protein